MQNQTISSLFAENTNIGIFKSSPHTVSKTKSEKTNSPYETSARLVLLGSSTGGLEALSHVFKNYPKDCAPTLVVQHTGENYGEKLVSILDKCSPAKILRAENGEKLRAGTVYIAAGGRMHLRVTGASIPRLELCEGSPVSGHIPSIDSLFISAIPFAKNCIAGVLTGMGKDGCEGLLQLRNAGARTFSQDEKSSVVYGMPRVAWDIGAAEHQVSISDMAAHILSLTENKNRN